MVSKFALVRHSKIVRKEVIAKIPHFIFLICFLIGSMFVRHLLGDWNDVQITWLYLKLLL